MNKIVTFTQRVDVIPSYNERRDCADQRIARFIYECGYIPVPLPNDFTLALCAVRVLKPCGIILTGGNSLEKYGGNAQERDKTEYELISYAIKNNIHLYGFCRGMQVILDYFGQPLESVTNHVATRHKLISPIWQNREVNSYHNQGIYCKNFKSENLQIMAYTDDGVVEAIRHTQFNIKATMWHPEREEIFNPNDIRFVQDLFGGKE